MTAMATSPAFSPLQQRCLDALGYTRYALAGGDSALQLAVPVVAATTQEVRGNALMVAILRTLRARIEDIPDPAGWLRMRGVESVAALRRDPAAKRALWKRLRAERSAR